MCKFEELSKEKNSVVENKWIETWKNEKILDKTIQNRENCKDFVFYDGPATANGMPGVHHMVAKLLKDSVCKYKTMKGYRVLRKVGWDTHGLPVEVQVEKELGFDGKKDIEAYGIEEFNKKCRENVFKNEKSFEDFTNKMGQFIDLENRYITYDNNYIETEWWILKEIFNQGCIYDGLKILPYCPRCGTGLASHEVAQGYKDISVNTVFVPFKLKDEDAYFLVWTTTPWTLIANVALCVNPNEDYVKVEAKGHKFILAKKLVDKVVEDYTILEEYKGSDLEFKEYEQFLPFLSVNKKAFYVTLADYVTMEDGTGIVHIAPAFGQDDYEVGLKYDLPILNPVDEQGCYTEGPWKGKLVVDSELEIEIVKYLGSQDKLFKKQKMVHNYPHCWRCKTPLVYYSKPSLYIKTTAIKDKIIEANKSVNWHPAYVGEKRFGNWLENMNDWAISRNRYWGTPIPLWRCECGHDEMIGSRSELVEKAIEKIDTNIELHRPYVDNVHIKCPKCGKTMTRVTDVIDCWFDSGSMPFSQYHYPFENKDLFEKQFPADFISEGVDQTRGWFYSLLVISTFIKGVSPYKNVLVNDLLLDKNGQKMHKSRGNAINPFDLMEKYGADPIRFFMLYTSPVWTPMKFDEDGVKEVQSKFFNTLKNTYTFFQMYANADKINPKEFNVAYEDLEEIDKWLLSKYNRLVKNVTTEMDNYDLNKAVKYLNDFVNEELSNWYIRRNRKRFWTSTLDENKKAVYQTTYEVLKGVCKLLAPIASFTSEDIYTKLTGEESVHLADYPVCIDKYLSDVIEKRMDLVRTLVTLGRNAREESKIKVRQPITCAFIDKKNEDLIKDLLPLIEEELNVKEVIFTDDLSNYMDFQVKPNFKEVGKTLGSKVKMFADVLSKLEPSKIEKLNSGEEVEITLDDEIIKVNKDMVDIRIQGKVGFDVSYDSKDFIILDTTLTKELKEEGIARELISKVQNMRKNKDFNITDRIYLYYEALEEVKSAIENFTDLIKNETLAITITSKEGLKESFDLNGFDVKIDVTKVEE